MTKHFAWLPTKVEDRNTMKQITIWFKFYYRELDYMYGHWLCYNFIPESINLPSINKEIKWLKK